MPQEDHVVTAPHEKWRYCCPTRREHTNWFPINGHFRCKGCAELRAAGNASVEPEFDALRDKQTGGLVPREELTLAIGENQPARA